MELFIKNESGDFERATQAELDEAFKEKSDLIVSKRIEKIREAEVKKAIEEATPKFEAKLREELTTKIKGEVESELKPKLEEAEKARNEVEVALRRKTVAAEFGFKPETEQFLGDGSEEEMRAKAETLRDSFAGSHAPQNLPEKESSDPKSSIQEKTGLDIRI